MADVYIAKEISMYCFIFAFKHGKWMENGLEPLQRDLQINLLRTDVWREALPTDPLMDEYHHPPAVIGARKAR